MPLTLGVLFAWLDTRLVDSGFASWDFLRNLNGAGSGAFDLYTALLVALVLRIAAFVVTLALVSPYAIAAAGRRSLASPASTLAVVALLILIGGVAAFLALPTFGLSVLAFALAEYYVFFVLAEGGTATEAILRSPRIATKNFPVTFVLVLAPVVAAAGADALVRSIHVPAAATLAGWLFMEMALALGLFRASVAHEARLHE